MIQTPTVEGKSAYACVRACVRSATSLQHFAWEYSMSRACVRPQRRSNCRKFTFNVWLKFIHSKRPRFLCCEYMIRTESRPTSARNIEKSKQIKFHCIVTGATTVTQDENNPTMKKQRRRWTKSGKRELDFINNNNSISHSDINQHRFHIVSFPYLFSRLLYRFVWVVYLHWSSRTISSAHTDLLTAFLCPVFLCDSTSTCARRVLCELMKK